MKDSLFDIVNKKNESQNNQKESIKGLYQSIHQTYLSQSYGYYTEIFIKKIAQKSQINNPKLLKFQLRKLMRETIKKYLMTDLQIIYLAYFTNQHNWNFDHQIIFQALNGTQNDQQILETNKIKLFLNLIAFFVKSYVGQKDELKIIIDFHRQNIPLFLPIFKLWIDQNPRKLFIISPRELNRIYTQYSRNCGKKAHRKDYNEMVDKILDLSTTYTIMPSQQRKKNQFINDKNKKQQVHIPSPSKRVTRNQSLSDIDKSYKIQFSDLRSHKKQSIILAGLSSLFVSNIQNQKVQIKQSQKSGQPRKLISLNKKKKIDKDQPNNVAKNFFCNKQISFGTMQDPKKSDLYLKDQINFLDMDSRIENVPFTYRNSSNIFGASNLF